MVLRRPRSLLESFLFPFASMAALAFLGTLPARQTGRVEGEQKISETRGGFGESVMGTIE